MRTFFLVLFLLLILGAAGYYLFLNTKSSSPLPFLPKTNTQIENTTVPPITVLAQNLDTPWAVAFLPNQDILLTQRPGIVSLVEKDKGTDPQLVAQIENVREVGEGGLLGIVLHPKFSENNYVYLYYTYDSQNDNTKNRVVRMVYKDKKLTNETIILDAIPGAANHNGGRLAFGPDGYLYITTGDAGNPSESQNTKSLAGKILRVTDEGKAVSDNPFKNEVYSYGHRNPQGIAWDETGVLWSSEHGRSGALSGLDEVNKIEKGANYGWPTIEGNETQAGMKTPVAHSGDFSTWAPGSIAALGNTLFFGGLRGSALYTVDPTSDEVIVQEYFKDTYGRIREVIVGPDKLLYMTTSNHDGRGTPKENDDRLIRVDPQTL